MARYHHVLQVENNRKDEVKRLYREKGLKAGLNVEETVDRRRHIRQMQQQLKERQIEEALIKVGVNFSLPKVQPCFCSLT